MPGPVARRLAAASLSLCACVCHAAADFGSERASEAARQAADWVLARADHRGQPFAIVDKQDPRIYIFEATGQLIGATSVLLGLASGDESVPDIAERAPSSLAPFERTTPAGRFATEPGHNDKGESIVWVDYDASLAIHRLRPAPSHEQRAARLVSPVASDHRISLGCIVVPVAFYEQVVDASLGRQRGVVYVLPETRPLASMLAPTEFALGSR